MKRAITGVLAVAALAIAAPTALADQPPGQLGYEGQPGNQGGNPGGGGGQPPGLLGYEGQPATRAARSSLWLQPSRKRRSEERLFALCPRRDRSLG